MTTTTGKAKADRLHQVGLLWGLAGLAVGVLGTLGVQTVTRGSRLSAGASDSLAVGGAPVDAAAPGGAAAPQAGAFGAMRPGAVGTAPIPNPTSVAVPQASPGSQPLAPGENPTPWQYDVAKNRYYDPTAGHQHWHNGPPPSNPGAPSATATTPQVTATSGAGQPIQINTSPVTTTGSNALKPGENPAPWEFDAAQNRHYDPRTGHQHWHPGPAPPPSQRQ